MRIRFICFCKKLTAIIVMLVNVNIAAGQAPDVSTKLELEWFIKSPGTETVQEFTISGFVKDEGGNPIANAMVSTVSGKNYITDRDGKFSFMLKKEEINVQNIFASFQGLVTAVRSYDPAMSNTIYNITLYKPAKCCPREKHDSISFQPLTLRFKNDIDKLPAKTKKELDSISSLLKENPEKKIFITAYSAARKSLQQLADFWLNAVKRYLIEINGISSDRINTQKLIDNNNNTSIKIEIKQ